MTNADKYLKEGIAANELCYKLSCYCSGIKFNGFTTRKLEAFFNEQAKPTLTEDERVILRNIEYFKSIARTDTGKLVLKPISNGDTQNFTAYNHLFQFIKERRRIFY